MYLGVRLLARRDTDCVELAGRGAVSRNRHQARRRGRAPEGRRQGGQGQAREPAALLRRRVRFGKGAEVIGRLID